MNPLGGFQGMSKCHPADVWKIDFKKTIIISPVQFTYTAFPSTIPSQHLPFQDNTPNQQTSCQRG